MKEDIKKFANSFVVRFFQRGGDFKERIDILNKAIKLAGIDATYHQDKKYNGNAYFSVDSDEEFKRAENFKDEILQCHPLGQFEWEANAVKRVIEKYRG